MADTDGEIVRFPDRSKSWSTDRESAGGAQAELQDVKAFCVLWVVLDGGWKCGLGKIQKPKGMYVYIYIYNVCVLNIY